MNAQSTPVKKKYIRSRLADSFSDVTPIKKCRITRKESICTNNVIDTNKIYKTMPELQIQGLHNKRKEGKEMFNKKMFNCGETNCSKSDMVWQGAKNSDYWCDEIKDLFIESFGDTAESFAIKTSPESDTCDIFKDFGVSGAHSEKINDNNDLDDSKKILINGVLTQASEKISEILTVSDVMKWSDQSFLPRNNQQNLSHHIKKKLLDNIKNKEVIKYQTSGWSQLNSSVISKLEYESFANCKNNRFYGLPLIVQKLYEEQKGIKELYSWQEECMNLKAVQNHQNLVYALPTSGGKTLVAELLILKEILCYKKNVLFILPYVSIVQEKIKDFSQFALDLGFLVEEYAAGKGVIPPLKRRRKNSVLIATIEKALIIVNSLIEAERLHEFGLIVVDELHMLSEEGRGAILESLLTEVVYNREKIQIIGMTATIGNLEEVAKFLKAETYVGNFRPVSLREYIKCDDKIYSIDWASDEAVNETRTLQTSLPAIDPDGIGELTREVIPNDSVLIFCPTRKNCENVASLLCGILPRNLTTTKMAEKKSLYRALISETNNQICPILKKTLPFGVAYHHSGLTAGERKLLEESFRDGTLSVICCTSTLAVGVNLPAKRVILRSPYVGKDFISLSKYKQMVGRAGRSGFGSEGESFLICQSGDLEKVKKLLRSQMDETTSKINAENCKDLVLAAVGLGIATTRRMLRELLACSLLHVQADKLNIDTKKMTDTCISKLYKHGALKIKKADVNMEAETSASKLNLNETEIKRSLRISNDSELMISRLGRAAMKGGLSIEKSHELYGDLIKAQSSLVLLTNLHLLYLVTPPEILLQIKPDFSLYFNAYMQLTANELHTAKVIGITELVMTKIARGIQPKNIQESVMNRFYVSLMLNELWKQQTIWNVATLFQLPRGLVQTLMTSASAFANCVLRFCEELEEFWCFKSLLTDFIPRLAHCCAAELLPLMDLPAVKRGRAKQLYEAGFKSLQAIAVAKPGELVRSIEHLPLKVAAQIIAAAKLLLMEKSENLKEEAENVLEGLIEKAAPKDI